MLVGNTPSPFPYRLLLSQDTLDKQSETLAGLRETDDRWRQKVMDAEERLREEGSRCSDLERALEDLEKRYGIKHASEPNGVSCVAYVDGSFLFFF